MALKLAQEDKHGRVADYLKISGINYDFENQICNISLYLFKDQAARLAGKLPIRSVGVSVDRKEGASLSRADLYPLIKLLTQFSGATDLF